MPSKTLSFSLCAAILSGAFGVKAWIQTLIFFTFLLLTHGIRLTVASIKHKRLQN